MTSVPDISRSPSSRHTYSASQRCTSRPILKVSPRYRLFVAFSAEGGSTATGGGGKGGLAKGVVHPPGPHASSRLMVYRSNSLYSSISFLESILSSSRYLPGLYRRYEIVCSKHRFVHTPHPAALTSPILMRPSVIPPLLFTPLPQVAFPSQRNSELYVCVSYSLIGRPVSHPANAPSSLHSMRYSSSTIPAPKFCRTNV
mmetsp:Transcript_41563/g.132788  ORF Transcript_41563/g.132788 Transcript_41563/m.132788 type:complete len:200 (-) Transcript_41563:320-919(-)